MGAELSCRELVELVTEYLEGGMPEEERARYEAHFELCAGCARYVEQILATARLARSAYD